MATETPLARPGDVITVPGHHVGDPQRTGTVKSVLGDPEHRRYEVLWEDGHESIFAPGGDAIIRRAVKRASRPKEPS